MGNLRVLALAGLAVIASLPAAHAADLPPLIGKAIPVIEDFAGGWYLRGDIGMTNQQMDRLSFVPQSEAVRLGVGDAQFEKIHLDFDSSPLVGVGIGYQFNNWIRADVTGEYRGKATFHGLERDRDLTGVNQYTASKSEWVGLANVYFDLGTWYGITPFVGGGVGFTHTTISNFIDAAPRVGGLAFAPESSKTSLAWAVHAGVAYDVTPNLKLELAYRYINLGDAETGTIIKYDNSGCRCLAYRLKNLDSHDVKVGMRWALNAAAPAAFPAAPIMARY